MLRKLPLLSLVLFAAFVVFRDMQKMPTTPPIEAPLLVGYGIMSEGVRLVYYLPKHLAPGTYYAHLGPWVTTITAPGDARWKPGSFVEVSARPPMGFNPRAIKHIESFAAATKIASTRVRYWEELYEYVGPRNDIDVMRESVKEPTNWLPTEQFALAAITDDKEFVPAVVDEKSREEEARAVVLRERKEAWAKQSAAALAAGNEYEGEVNFWWRGNYAKQPKRLPLTIKIRMLGIEGEGGRARYTAMLLCDDKFFSNGRVENIRVAEPTDDQEGTISLVINLTRYPDPKHPGINYSACAARLLLILDGENLKGEVSSTVDGKAVLTASKLKRVKE